MNTYPIVFRVAVALLCVLTLGVNSANAGRNCEEPKPLSVQTFTRSLALAEKTHLALEAEFAHNATKVVVLARAGQNLSKYNLRYSHLGFAYRTTDGRWLVAHKLNECGSSQAHLFRQGLGEFFLDDLFRFEAAWVIPKASVQERLHALVTSDAEVKTMHNPNYSMVSYAWSTKYQQSNQWAIEVFAMANEPRVRTRNSAQAWLQVADYTPSTLNISALTRLGGMVTKASISFDDHPTSKRFADKIETVTVDSVFDWMQRTGLSGPVVRIQ
jgi:hypothetical protein